MTAMRAVDVHQHLWPPSFVEALRARRAPPCLDGRFLQLAEGAYEVDVAEHDPAARLALLDRHGLDAAVVSLQPTLGLETLEESARAELEAAWEEGILAVAAEAQGRLVPLAARRPRAGFAGACIGARSLDDLDSLAPVLDALRGEGFLLVHPQGGSPPVGAPAWWAAVVDYTSQMQHAWLSWLVHGQPRWPDVRVVFAVLAGGGPVQLERLASRGVGEASLRHANVFLDTASYGPRALRLCADAVGLDRLVLGTDVPVVEAAHALGSLRALGPEVAAAVSSRAEALLPTPPAGRSPGAR